MKFYYSKAKLLGYQLTLILVIEFLLYGIYAFPSDGRVFFYGWFAITLIAVVVVLSIPTLLKSEPQVIINNLGIQDTRNRLGLIPWDNILAIQVKPFYFRFRKIKLYYYMVIKLKNSESYKSRISQTQKEGANENSPFAISFHILKPSIKDATEFITSHHPSIIVKYVD